MPLFSRRTFKVLPTFPYLLPLTRSNLPKTECNGSTRLTTGIQGARGSHTLPTQGHEYTHAQRTRYSGYRMQRIQVQRFQGPGHRLAYWPSAEVSGTGQIQDDTRGQGVGKASLSGASGIGQGIATVLGTG